MIPCFELGGNLAAPLTCLNYRMLMCSRVLHVAKNFDQLSLRQFVNKLWCFSRNEQDLVEELYCSTVPRLQT